MQASLTTALLLFALLSPRLHAAEPDFTFAGTGVAAGPAAGRSDAIRMNDGLAVDPADDSVFFVYAHHMFPGVFTRMVRVKASGEVDPSFGGGRGYAELSTSFGGAGVPTFGALALDPLRRIVVAFGSSGSVRLMRVSRFGAVEVGFSPPAPLTGVVDSVDIAVQPDSKVVVVTGAHPPGTAPVVRRMVVMRYTEAGMLDASFGGDGIVDVFIEGSADYNYGSGVALAPDGKIVVAGTARRGTRMDAVVARFLPDGSPDLAFGHFGVAILPFGTESVYTRRVAVHGDGTIVVGATLMDPTGHSKLATFRLSLDGGLDGTYGYGGWITEGLGPETTLTMDVAIQDDGKPVLAGFHDRGVAGSSTDIAAFVMRQTPAGLADESFSARGYMDVPLPTLYTDAYAGGVGIDSAGRILVAGVTTNAFFSRWFVARLIP